jgi:hypothetical protein
MPRFQDKRASHAVAAARSRWGSGFDLLSPELQEAVVSRELLAVVTGFDAEDYDSLESLQRVVDRLQDMIFEALGSI